MIKYDIRPGALTVGIAVAGGLILYSFHKKKRCRNLKGIYEEHGPVHLTEEAQDRAFEVARRKVREHLLSNENPDSESLNNITLYIANDLRDCSWGKLETYEQKTAWDSISKIVNEVNQMAKSDPEAFLKSF